MKRMPKLVFMILYEGEWFDLSDYVTDVSLSEEADKILPKNFWEKVNERGKAS